MGDLQVEGGFEAMEDRLLSAQAHGTAMTNPDPYAIEEETWAVAEKTTSEVVGCIHPTLDSEERRKDVMEYVQRLIKTSLGFEVYPYGSVPLKTYLPDGDIDLTTLSTPNVEESLARDVLAILQSEERNESAEYEVKDTQFIDAEVKLVKCLVQNIVIDISFNQLGGLSTLCFLEQVDRMVVKDHLFKRSIILIKAWCYYESRILGAHHGLISTYALETLVLYIFRFFNSTLNGPLAVLYRFLDYFSRFDWENYCLSLDGPVPKSSLPDIVAIEKPENVGNGLMLTDGFLKNCIDMFTVPSKGLEANSRGFPQKHLNIIDPLKENNNLGRSVHRGNFYRIRSAFRYGARKLGRILLLPKDRIADEINKFFSNTLKRHGSTYGPNLHNSSLIIGAKGLGSLSLSSQAEIFFEDDIYSKLSNIDFDDDTSGAEVESNLGSREEVAFSGQVPAGDANDLATFRSLSLQSANETFNYSPRSSQFSGSQSGKQYYVPHLYFSGSSAENGDLENGYLGPNKSSDSVDRKIGFDSWMEQRENLMVDEDTMCVRVNNYDHVSCSNSVISSQDANVSDSLSLDFREKDLAGSAGEVEALDPLSDLTGDYQSHLRSLLYGQSCHGYALSAHIIRTSPPTSPSQFQNRKPWEIDNWSLPLNQNLCSQLNTNGVVGGQPIYFSSNNSTPSAAAAFGWEERQKARGTGTYFPNPSCCSCKERPPSQWKGRNRASGTSGQLQRARSFGSADMNTFSEANRDFQRSQSLSQGRGKFGSFRQSHLSTQGYLSASSRQSHLAPQGNPHHPAEGNPLANGFSHSPRKLEFGSFGPLPEEMPDVAVEVQSSKLVYGRKQERVEEISLHLKNEDEFPPLSA